MEETVAPKLQHFFKAGYPALFLRTTDPYAAEQMVREALLSLGLHNMRLGVWRVTTGLIVKKAGTPEEVEGSKAEKDLGEVLRAFLIRSDPISMIFHNLRQVINQPTAIQNLVDTIYSARMDGSNLVFVGPLLEVPPELRSLIQFVDCPLPTQADLEKQYSMVVKSYGSAITIPSDKEAVAELIRSAAAAAVGLDAMAAENALALSLATTKSVDLAVIQSQKEQEVRKSDVLEFWSSRNTMGDLGGFSALKEWLLKRKRAFTEEAREFGLHYPKGFILVGPAGSGKSLCAQVTAHYLGLPLLRFDMGKIFRSLLGESEAAVRQALKVAEAVSPCVLWMDEIDKGLAGMAGSGELDSGVTSRVVSTILTWRQETTAPVMMVATANTVTNLPSMVYRRGRFDKVWATDLPSEQERKEIFAIHFRKRKRDPGAFNLGLLAARTIDFVGAEIEGVIEDALYSAFDEHDEVSDAYVIKAITDTIPMSHRDKEELAAIREWVSTRASMVSGTDKPHQPSGKLRTIR